MRLTDKITSHEDFIRARIPKDNFDYASGESYEIADMYGRETFRVGGYRCNVWSLDLMAMQLTDRFPKSLWWLAREYVRVIHKVYPENTSVLAKLAFTPQLCDMGLHLSPADPNLIEFTMDATKGAADQQVRMALGRFLKKYMPSLDDATVQRIEALHRAELSDEVEFIEAAGIMQAYLDAAVGGVGACMSKAKYEGAGNLHPAEAYNAPGFRLAVLRKGGEPTGQLSARCLVWENPADPKDKRMIRVYGDSMLERRLKKQGFVYKPLTGAMLKLQVVGSSADLICAPYLDGVMGDQGKLNGRFIVRRPDGLQIVDADTANALQRALPNIVPAATCAQNSGGTYRLREVPYDATLYTCVLSGEKLDGITHPPANYRGADGKHATVSPAALTKAVDANTVKQVRDYDENDNVEWVYCHVDTPTFETRGYTYIETDRNREHTGWCKLDPGLYPNDQTWHQGGTIWIDGGRQILVEDAVQVIRPGQTYTTRIHKSELPEDAVRVADAEGEKTWALPGVEFVLTDTKRKVVPGVHEVTQLFDGSWTYSRNVASVEIFGTTYYVKKGDLNLPRLKEIDQGQIQYRIRRCTERVAALRQVIGYSKLIRRVTDGTRVMEIQPDYNDTAFRNDLTFTLSLADKTAEQIVAEFPATTPTVAQRAAAAGHNFKLLHEVIDRVFEVLEEARRKEDERKAAHAARVKAATDMFPIGSRVTVSRKTDDNTKFGEPWEECWAGYMDELVDGTVAGPFEVRRVDLVRGVQIYVEHWGERLWLPSDAVEPVLAAVPVATVEPVTTAVADEFVEVREAA